MNSRSAAVFALVALAVWLPPARVDAWGHLPDFGVASQSGTVILKVIEEGHIRFCVQSEDERYRDDDLEILVEASLRVWLAQVEDLIGREVAIEHECDIEKQDLLVLFGDVAGGRSPDGPADFAFRRRLHRGANYFSLIAFNTVGTNASFKELVFMSALDFLSGADGLDETRKLEYLQRISQNPPRRLRGRNFGNMATAFGRVARTLDLATDDAVTVSERLNIDGNPADLYPVMIHEFGHVFGLCDMRPAPYEVRCNREWRSDLTNDSIMAFGGYGLRDDDIEGIRSIFERFVRRPFLDGRIFGHDGRTPTDRFDRSLVRIERKGLGPVVGTFVGDCATVLASGHGLFPDGEQLDPQRDIIVRPLWRDEPLPVDWVASGFDATDPTRFVSHTHPEQDFFLLRLSASAAGCEPARVDEAQASAVINAGGPFAVVSLGGFDDGGRISAGAAKVQENGSCQIFIRPFGNKFYRDPTTFVTDCDLTRENEGSPVFAERDGDRFLIGIAAGSDRLAQHLRGNTAYLVPGSAGLARYEKGPTFQGTEGNISGANLFIRLGGGLLQALQ